MAAKYRDLDTFFEKRKKTHEWLAEQLDVDRSYVTLIASGKRQPSLRLALRIESLTGVPLKSLLRRRGEAAA